MGKSIFFTKKLKTLIFFYIFLFLLSINSILCGTCKNVYDLLNKTCYNDVITFNHSKYRAGHACTNNQGNMIVEFSTDPEKSNIRLFYGLNNRGRYYFPGEPVFKEVNIANCPDCEDNGCRGRFESRNLLVHLSNDASREKQYMFSMSIYYSVAELIDIDDRDNFKFYTWNMTKFLNISRPIFSYEFSLFEIEQNRIYITAFIESAGYKNVSNEDKEYSNTTSLIKFQFDNFGEENYRQILKTITLENTYDGRVVSAFRLDDSKLICVTIVCSDQKYKAKFYDDDLNYKGECSIYDNVQNLWEGYGIFFKGISVKGDYAALALYHDGHDLKSLVFKFVKFIFQNNNYDFEYKHERYYSVENKEFYQGVQTNGLYKLNDNRLVLFAAENSGSGDNLIEAKTMHMFLFDLYENYEKLKVREYKFDYPERRFAKEVDASMYNGYIVFTATISDKAQSDMFAIMMIFGFANGTDHEIDISPYLMDTGYYNSTNNLYDYLMSTMTIDNNIFDYERIEKIRLIKICDELKLYKGEYGVSQEESVLPLNELFDANHTLLQNKAITKEENKLYSLEYQFMVKEPTYANLYSSAIGVWNKPEDANGGESEYERNILNGRVNILKFKLCHKYCIHCIEFGPSDNDQRCVDCKVENTYDYLMYVNRFNGSCVPKGFMYDVENKLLQLCSSEKHKYYFNLTRDKEKYCFKFEYDCPDVYHFFNETTNECIDYSPPTTLPIPTTIIIPPTTIINPPTTIIIPPTTIINPPTTIINPPTTIIIPPSTIIIPPTTIIIPPTTIIIPPTTIPIKTPTTIPIPPTTIPNIISTVPIITPSTMPKIPTTIIQEECKYGKKINYTDSYSNLKNEDIYEIVKEDIIKSYCLDGSNVKIAASKGHNLEISNTLQEIKSRAMGEPSMDITECENILRDVYDIDIDKPLIVLKNIKNDNSGDENIFQYQLFHPDTREKLNTSYCENTTVDVYVSYELSEKQESIYNNLKEQGYDPFDLNDRFYREICTPYTSENGTDVLLDDREEFVYSSLVNATLCPIGCDYQEFYANKKYIKCECGANNSDIVLLDLEHLSGSNVYKSFLSTMKSTNYKVMICYNLVFNFKIFCHNYGSIITLILFCVYVIYIAYYCFKEISPVKVHISKLLFEEQNKENVKRASFVRRPEKRKSTKKKLKEKAEHKGKNPPKKGKVRKSKNEINHLATEDIDFIEDAPKRASKERTKSKRKKTNKSLKKPSAENLVINEIQSEATGIGKTKKIDVVKEKKSKDEKKDKEEKKYKNLDNFELNNLEFVEACEYDKRSFCTTYCSVLMREHLVLLTFFSCKDYNLFYVKFEKFLVLFCTDMTMNGLFFIHESMHKKYTNGEDFTFVQKLPQLLFTLIVAHILEVILCFLSFTDTHVYEIKNLPNDKNKGEKILNILDCIKRKLVGFFTFTFLLFLFYWYFISAFCAVYQNTQKIFLRDSMISFLTSLIDPFIIYGFTNILRFISLCLCCRKNCFGGCLYKISDLIPIF